MSRQNPQSPFATGPPLSSRYLQQTETFTTNGSTNKRPENLLPEAPPDINLRGRCMGTSHSLPTCLPL